ncbi:MAG TPA: GGDEF domain-containing protein [Candidatus Acidoferrales bacterium]|nr:GGDEF domain-containing protein [Candidatus Acidoferrales bacterium]
MDHNDRQAQNAETDPKNVTFRSWEYSARLRELRWRDWWMWAFSVLVILVLTASVVSLSFPAILADRKSAFGASVLETILGLIGVILIFICYLTYEKVLINRLRTELAERQFHSSLWRNLALVDPLTGLYNRRFAERHLKIEIARARRRGYALTLVLFDLNNLKQTNDRLGHLAGDVVIKGFADRLAEVVREGDLAARLGGDEFMLLLTDCKVSQVPDVLHRLESITVDMGTNRIPVTFSQGAAEYHDGDTPEDFFRSADNLLYENKQAHKQAVVSPAK